MAAPTHISRVCPDVKEALQSCSDVQTIKITGLWHVPSFRELKVITSHFVHLRRIEVQGLHFRGADIHLDFFNHIFRAFPHLESLELGVRIEKHEVIKSLKTAAQAAPARPYKSLAILPYSISGAKIHYSSEEADIVSILAPLAAKATSAMKLGMNASAFAELVDRGMYLGVQNLSLAFPLELHRDIASTDNYLDTLPSSFIYNNQITSLELISISPFALAMEIANEKGNVGTDPAIPFPKLLHLRIANPGWMLQNDGDREKAEAQAIVLRAAMANRGVVLEWEDIDRCLTPKEVWRQLSTPIER